MSRTKVVPRPPFTVERTDGWTRPDPNGDWFTVYDADGHRVFALDLYEEPSAEEITSAVVEMSRSADTQNSTS